MKNNDERIENLVHSDAIEKMKEIVNHTNTCLFVTNFSRTPAEARPMATQEVDESGAFWFFSDENSNKNFDLEKDSRTQLFYSNPAKSEFMTVFGQATVSRDRERIEELWTPIVQAWFKGGKDDPSLTVIKVVPEEAYYWDTKNSKMVSLIKIVTSVLTGDTMDDGVEGSLTI